ncbi:hypothetical protein L3Q65_00060 (plasmid) [Amycolatopsis sp. FU40]|uniref:hypothetical protein n=1 Tax=Amycolatopsis sp. FU40 TaxID=2914159 RepID=UPI001F27CD4C|nr:hypothetical protein [Amycolatopsis sp. FU40]UKD50753.1 hypothetical protein L3Q65_00060 [Amycolatopsis sp. FU40]
MSTSTSARTWLAGCGTAPTCPRVRDDQLRVWSRGADGRYHTPDGRHHHTADELHARTDLVEVTR